MARVLNNNCIWVAFNPTESDTIWYKHDGINIKEVQIDESVDFSFSKDYGAMIYLSYDGKLTKIEIL